MARRRFFVEAIHSGLAEVTGEDAHHLTRVLRVEPGQRYEISDNRNVYLAEVTTAQKARVVFQTVETVALSPPPAWVILLVSLIKFDHFEWMLEKCTELGAARIVPVVAERTEKGLDRAAERRSPRWRRIVLEASQQSRRDQLPELSSPIRWDTAIRTTAAARLLLDEARTAPQLPNALPAGTREVALLVGPEGGWTARESLQAHEHGWTPVSLGPQILRAETAAMAATALVISLAASWIPPS